MLRICVLNIYIEAEINFLLMCLVAITTFLPVFSSFSNLILQYFPPSLSISLSCSSLELVILKKTRKTKQNGTAVCPRNHQHFTSIRGSCFTCLPNSSFSRLLWIQSIYPSSTTQPPFSLAYITYLIEFTKTPSISTSPVAKETKKIGFKGASTDCPALTSCLKMCFMIRTSVTSLTCVQNRLESLDCRQSFGSLRRMRRIIT